MDSVKDRIWGCRVEHGDMEHWVDGTKAIWELKGDQVGAGLCYNLIGTQELISKLL